MPYKFTPDRENYEMYAGGSVLYAAPGHVAFPIRLSNEIFRRCMALWNPQSGRCTLYDPCCGGAYHLTTLAYFNWDRIGRIVGSDVEADALSLAARNLSLLELDGLDRRIEELAAMSHQFGKMSHAEALKHAKWLKQRLEAYAEDHRIETHVFQADATDRRAIMAGLAGVKVDIVITDIPYGQRSFWRADSLALASAQDPVHQLLESLLPVLAPAAVVAVEATKTVQIKHESYQQLGKFKMGKRLVVFLKESDT